MRIPKKLQRNPYILFSALVVMWSVLLLSRAAFAVPPQIKCVEHTRSHSEPARFKRQYPCPSTGKRYGACPGYVIDHVVSLCAGGKDAVSNMAWQTVKEAKLKDKWENTSSASQYVENCMAFKRCFVNWPR